MKKQFCKILLAVSFLFLVPALCMSQNLKGIWKLVQSEGSSQVVRYKVLDKDGNYFNVDAYIKDAVDVSSGSRSSDDVFCPYKITRSGEYSIIAKGLYCEKLRNEHGRSANAIVPISYRIGHYKIFCVNGNTGFKFESRIFYFIHLQNEENYERKESSSAR